MSADGTKKPTAYYVRVRGKIHGPFDVERLRKLQARGQFSRAHEVSTDKRSWRAAGTLTELFAQTELPGAEAGENVFLPADAAGVPTGILQTGPPEGAKWYYNVGDERHGPVSLVDLRQLILNGQVTPHDLVWREGMPDWAPVGNQSEFQFLQRNAGGFQPALLTSEGMGVDHSRLPRMSGLAVASLTLGIIGIVLPCTLGICSIFAIVFGGVAIKDIGRSKGLVTGRGMAVAGLIMGIIGVVVWAILWVLWFLSILTLPVR